MLLAGLGICWYETGLVRLPVTVAHFKPRYTADTWGVRQTCLKVSGETGSCGSKWQKTSVHDVGIYDTKWRDVVRSRIREESKKMRLRRVGKDVESQQANRQQSRGSCFTSDETWEHKNMGERSCSHFMRWYYDWIWEPELHYILYSTCVSVMFCCNRTQEDIIKNTSVHQK